MIRAGLALLLVATLTRVSGLRLIFVDGESMAPTIRSGDLVVTAELPLPLLGNRGAIVLREEREGVSEGLLLHRVVERGSGWRRTAGDASSSPDAGVVLDRHVHGVLIAVLPVAPITRAIGSAIDIAHAAFTGLKPISVQFSSSNGAPLSRVAFATTGADSGGRLLPAGRTASTYQLGWAGRSRHTLRIDATIFSHYTTSATPSIRSLARSLRIATLCREASNADATWWTASDVLTAEWSAANAASGELLDADPAEWPSGLRCEITATLLGSLGAQSAALEIPLVWSP